MAVGIEQRIQIFGIILRDNRQKSWHIHYKTLSRESVYKEEVKQSKIKIPGIMKL